MTTALLRTPCDDTCCTHEVCDNLRLARARERASGHPYRTVPGAPHGYCLTCGVRPDLHADVAASANADYLDSVTCADCGYTRGDARRCDSCGTVQCCVRTFTCDAGGPDGADLCPGCTPSHRGCPECDPPDAGDR